LYIRNIIIIFYLFLVPSDCRRFRRTATTFQKPAPGHPTPGPGRNLKVIELIWGLKIPRKRTCEHPRRLHSASYIRLMKNTSLYLDRAALHLNSHPHRSFWLTRRNHTARRSKSGVYAEVVCRKCRERSTSERQSHLDTSTTHVCPLIPQYVHSAVYLRV